MLASVLQPLQQQWNRGRLHVQHSTPRTSKALPKFNVSCCSAGDSKASYDNTNHQQQQLMLLGQEQQQQVQQRQQQQQQKQQQQHSRRGFLHAFAAAAIASVAVPAVTVQPSAAAAAVSSSSALEEYMKLEDQNKLKDQKSLDNIRSKYGIKRNLDGRVQLKRKNGTWMSVRLDMEVPGAILLRDTKSGAIFALETDGLPQVDLSDDYVLFMMFADSQWENDMTAIEFEDDSGRTAQLTMTEKEFHEFVGLLKEPDEPEPPTKGSSKKK